MKTRPDELSPEAGGQSEFLNLFEVLPVRSEAGPGLKLRVVHLGGPLVTP